MPRSESSTPSTLIRTSTKPYTRPDPNNKSSTMKYWIKEEKYKYENPNDLIPSSSPAMTSISTTSSEDGSSEYNPTIMTGVKKDIKPNLSDLSFDENSDSESDRPKKKSKISTKKSNITPTKNKSGSTVKNESRSNSGTPKKSVRGLGRTWSAEEDWALFKELHPKVGKPDWNGVAGIVGNGRDSKSCQNRYALISKKLESVIKSIGGA